MVNDVHYSQERALELITQGSVWVDNKRVKDPESSVGGSPLYIYEPEFPVTPYHLDSKYIQYEDEFLLIVYKEHGLNTVPSPLSDQDNLLYGVQNYLSEQGSSYLVNPVHRLDKPTGGLVIFAKDKSTELLLHRLFLTRKIKKLYVAATLPVSLAASAFFVNEKVSWKGKIQDALTHITVLKREKNRFYYLVYPLTGRFHQIRQHFKEKVAPIIGDAQYGTGYTREDTMLLACVYYKFPHPVTGKSIEVEYHNHLYFPCS